MKYAKMTKTDLIEEIIALGQENKAWLEKCTDMEAQLASSRLVLQPIYQRFKVEDTGCDCELCVAMRTLFEKPGGRAMVEEFREQRMAINEAFQILGNLLAQEDVHQGRMKKAVVWLARLSGRTVAR